MIATRTTAKAAAPATNRQAHWAMGILAALLAVAATALASISGTAAATPATTCTMRQAAIRLDPGLGLQPTSGTFHDEAEGTIECDGPVLGKGPTGPGVWHEGRGRYGVKSPNSCTSDGDGEFVHSFRIPTKDGEVSFTNTGTFTFGLLHRGSAGGGVLGGQLDGNEGRGTFTIQPKEGDCVSAPVTLFSTEVTMQLKH